MYPYYVPAIPFQPSQINNPHFPFQSDLVIHGLQISLGAGHPQYVEYSPQNNPFSFVYGKHTTGNFVPSVNPSVLVRMPSNHKDR